MGLYEAHIDLAYSPGGPGSITLFAAGIAEADGTVSGTKATAWRDLVNTFRQNISGPAWNGVTTSTRPKVIGRNPTTGAALQEFGVATASDIGGNSGVPLPQMSSLVVGWRTTLPTRRGRGRSFMPPAATISQQTDSTPTAAYVAGHQSAADAFIAASAASTFVNFVVWHRPVGGVGGFVTIVSTAVIRDVWGSLRSRRD